MHKNIDDHKCNLKNCTCACHKETIGGGAELERPVDCTNKKCGCNHEH